jgi:anti-anti-sigma factor
MFLGVPSNVRAQACDEHPRSPVRRLARFMDVVEPFAIDIDERDDRVVVTPRGELDMASAPELEQAVMPRLQDGGWIVLDLRSLDFIDSSGLRVVVGAHRLAEERGGRFTCVRGAPGSTVHRIVEIAGIDGVIEMVDDPAQPQVR